MKDCIFFSSVNCLGLLAALLVLADCESGGPLIRNPQSEIRNWEPVGLSGEGGIFSPTISPAAFGRLAATDCFNWIGGRNR